MWMIDEEEDQNPKCLEDSIECASRQSCAALSDHACGDRPAEPHKKYLGESLSGTAKRRPSYDNVWAH
jgi:hypothetical protein